MDLGNVSIKVPAFYEKRIEYCQEFCSLFPETDKLIIENMKRAEAESYFALGLVEEGEKAFQDLVKDFPDSAWAYIGWGDMYKDLGDYDQAESIYRMALEKNVAGKEEVLERLEMLEEEKLI
jgi:tetratricopeptide (TPR) repeat protein